MHRIVSTRPYHHLNASSPSAKKTLSAEAEKKVDLSLLNHVYSQTIIALFASLCCAALVFIGLFTRLTNQLHLFIWFGIFCLVTVMRLLSVIFYQRATSAQEHLAYWRIIYIMGSALGGLSWGLAGIILFPDVNAIQQMLIILMLAGVTAGVVSLASAIPAAASSFLLGATTPYVISILFLNNIIYLLFDVALVLYVIYSIIIIIRTHQLIRDSIILKFDNDSLLADLTQAKSALEITNQKLKIAATHDSLTKIANRRLFEFNIREAIEKARKNNKSLVLFYIDIDNFKKINDLHGHRIGDNILIELTDRFIHYFGKNNNIARLGGDEFTILLDNITDYKEIEPVAQHICQIAAQPIKMDDLDINLSVSIGISIYPLDGVNIDSLLHCADERMYCVKQQGGGSYFALKDLVE